MMRKFIFCFLAIIFLVLNADAQVLFVKTTPSGFGDGSSWDNAYDGKYLAKYLRETVVAGTVIHVAEGTYIPYVVGEDNVATAREYSFVINQNSIEIYGGYSNSSTGTGLTNRDPHTYITRLSGEIDNPSVTDDNCYSVVKVPLLTGTVKFDGVYISDGYGLSTVGGGITSPSNTVLVLNDVVVEKNKVINTVDGVTGDVIGGYGAGIHTNFAVISNSVVRNNYASVNGGGVYVRDLTLDNSSILDNRADGSGGGLVVSAKLKLIGDIVIERDTSVAHGAGAYFGTVLFDFTEMTSLKIDNCAGIGASNGGALTFNGGVVNFELDGSSIPISISGNSAFRGAAINTNAPANITLRNLTIENNTSRAVGGAITFQGSLNLDGVTFLNNKVANAVSGLPVGNGGAIATTGLMMGTSADNVLNITNCTFIENSANAGGAIYATSSSFVSIQNSTFSKNIAANSAVNSEAAGGGAIRVSKWQPIANAKPVGSVSVILSSFNANVAVNGDGHSICLGEGDSKTINGNLFYNNNASGIEINLVPVVGTYNVLCNTNILDATNVDVPIGKMDSIFTDIAGDNTAILMNNGGTTPTFKIVKNGFAYNVVPLVVASTWGIPATDQADQTRSFSCKVDAGSFELQQLEDPMTYLAGTAVVCPNTLLDANTTITSRTNVKKVAFFSDAGLTNPLTMPLTMVASITVYARITSVSNCDVDETIQLGVYALQSTWDNNANDSDWNNPTNWSDGIPGPCTNVIIPGGKNEYPILHATTNAVCDTIDFKFGGEVARTNCLEYSSAKVDVTLKPNQWYMLAPALQQQYSGDYLEEGSQYRINPEIFIMYYQTGNPQTGSGKVSSKFTGLFKNTDELLRMTTGHAIWIDQGIRSESDFTLHYPKDSTVYAYYNQLNEVFGFSGTMARDKNDRFIYEGNPSYIANNDGTFSQTIENSDLFPQLIIGNPYMSHMDIVEFQSANDPYLEKTFRIWKNGTSYESYLIDGNGDVITTDTGEDGFQIPPMQSFIIDTKVRFTSPLSFTPTMSITQPGKTLRSAKAESVKTDLLNVEVLRENVRQSALTIRYKEGVSRNYNKNKDVWTVIPEHFGSYVSLYSLVDGGATSIYTTGDVITPINLDIAVGNTIKASITKLGKEVLTIQIAGTNKYLNKGTVYLIDTVEKVTHKLSAAPYRFNNTTGDIKGRFQLYTVDEGASIDESDDNDDLQISYQEGKVVVLSNQNDLVRSVSIYDITGKLLYNSNNINATDCFFGISEDNQIVIVKVQTENDSKTRRILTR